MVVLKAALAANFSVWATTPEAEFLNGKFLWVNWDVEELKKQKKDIVENHKLQFSLAGYEPNY